MKELIKLFFVFAKLGVTNFGGGYALLPLLERDIVEKHGWATKEEITDYYAIGQCTPGVISVNVSTFIGFKLKGVIGGIIATLGFITPSIIIILLLATVLTAFGDNKYVLNAFAGINACVVALILNSAIKIFKKSIIDKITLLLFFIVCAISVFTPISPIFSVLTCGILGIIICNVKEKRTKTREEIITEEIEKNNEEDGEEQ